MLYLTAAAALLFAAIHIFISRLRFIDIQPRSRWLSFAGGVAVAYVFLHVLPELATHGDTFSAALAVRPKVAEEVVYLLALVGLVTFYGLERAAKLSRQRGGRDLVEAEVLWLHVISFALYNLLIGYLLLGRQEEGYWALLIYVVAMALHFVTNDYGLRQDQQSQYDRFGRWVLAAAVLLGWLLAALVELSEVSVAFLFAFLAGGIVLNVLKEELPRERESRFWPFLLGGVGYGGVLLAHAALLGG